MRGIIGLQKVGVKTLNYDSVDSGRPDRQMKDFVSCLLHLNVMSFPSQIDV